MASIILPTFHGRRLRRPWRCSARWLVLASRRALARVSSPSRRRPRAKSCEGGRPSPGGSATVARGWGGVRLSPGASGCAHLTSRQESPAADRLFRRKRADCRFRSAADRLFRRKRSDCRKTLARLASRDRCPDQPPGVRQSDQPTGVRWPDQPPGVRCPDQPTGVRWPDQPTGWE